MSEELLIDETNFCNFFRDIKTSTPSQNDEVVAFRCLAYFCRGDLKQEIMDLLCFQFGSVRKCIGKLVKSAGTTKVEAIKLLHMMCYDMLNCHTRKEVFEKEYPFWFEKLYYANPEHVPTDDKRWQILRKMN